MWMPLMLTRIGGDVPMRRRESTRTGVLAQASHCVCLTTNHSSQLFSKSVYSNLGKDPLLSSIAVRSHPSLFFFGFHACLGLAPQRQAGRYKLLLLALFGCGTH
jgi:hypothetical protein